uniref:Uncharacterized protein n=1 Tax=Anguilla anguilla TaxID=7936 RepID=A0A0E9SA02_ANGAN
MVNYVCTRCGPTQSETI